MPEADWYDSRFDPYMLAVGKIAVIWAHLEFAINQAIWELENVESGAGACVTAQLIGPGPRMRAFITLIDYRCNDPKTNAEIKLLNDFNRLSQKIDGLGRQRNVYLHQGAVIEEGGKIKRVHISADKKLEFDFVPADIENMEKLSNDIRNTRIKFEAIFERAQAALPPWPRIQFERSSRGLRSRRSTIDTDS
jgi:hypothetical protein